MRGGTLPILLIAVIALLACPTFAQDRYATAGTSADLPVIQQAYRSLAPIVAPPSVSTLVTEPLADIIPPANIPPANVAQDISYSELTQRLTELEAKIATQATEIQQASLLTSATQNPMQCGTFCGDREPLLYNWFAGIDLTILQPSYNSPSIGIYDDEMGVGPRLFVGRESYRGFGWRTIFWWIDTDSEAIISAGDPVVLVPFVLNLQASRFDLDFYRRFSSENGSLLFGTGITAAGLRFKFDDVLAITEEGGGVSVFAEGRHRFYNSESIAWSVLSRGRWSYLVGEWEDVGATGLVQGDSNINIAEAELALEFTRKFDAYNFVASYGIEVQAWDTTFFDKTSFLGSTVRLGMTW